MFHKYLFFFSLFLFSSLTCFSEESSSSSFDLNTEDEMIADFYNHPEKIPEIDKICVEDLEWAKGRFNIGMAQLYHKSLFCYTWDINKKLSPDQITLLTHLKSSLSDTISDIYPSCFPIIGFLIEHTNEFNLQLLARIYNIINKTTLPECAFESNISLGDFGFLEPCNTDSELIKLCEKEKDMISCMEQNLITSFPKLITPDQQEQATQHIQNLTNLTENFIKTISSDKDSQNKEIKKLYNFYWILIHNVYDNVIYYINHDEDNNCSY